MGESDKALQYQVCDALQVGVCPDNLFLCLTGLHCARLLQRTPSLGLSKQLG